MTTAKLVALRAILPSVSRETFERLLAFEATFRDWNSRMNLASVSSTEHLWDRHILDSAQLACLEPIRGIWLDIGSGGGFPGVVLAILMAGQEPAVESDHVHLVESVGKKSTFLRAALAATGGRGTVHQTRAEDTATLNIGPAIVTARALAPLPELLRIAFPWLKMGAKGLFHKGRRHSEEVAAARGDWFFDLLQHQSKTDPDSVILEISNVSRRL